MTDTAADEDSVTEDAQAVGAPGFVTKQGAVEEDTSSAKPAHKIKHSYNQIIKILLNNKTVLLNYIANINF